MKRFVAIILFLSILLNANTQDLSYYLPDSFSYKPSIPKPKDIIHHEVGEWHVTHDRLVNYMKAIATAAPDRVKLQTYGYTYENRPQVMLIITSPKNHQNLEQIRQQHLLLSDPSRSASVNINNMPAVVWIGSSIHGNEPSGSNAALVNAYHLAAAQGKAIDNLLDNVIILLDPSFNPDGLQRFSTWVNQHRSKNLVSDPNSREYNEVWPGGRFNHYWFDLNRDWLPAVHPESQNRLKVYHQWKPNVLTDHHEMGSHATFFFQPGVPSRVNPLTPPKNQELTQQIAYYHAAYLDKIGSLYYTKEGYDDFYYGKGSTYPDVNGAVGILFEQASSRGHVQETANGLLTFPFTIRNQFTTMLSTMHAVKDMRKELLNFQKEFYQSALAEAASANTKAYVFGDEKDEAKTREFVKMLQRHQIEVYDLNKNVKASGTSFIPGTSFIIPSAQPQSRLINAIFGKTFDYKDSLFYDITSWTMPLAYGLPSAELNAAQYNSSLLGKRYEQPVVVNAGIMGGKSNYAYFLEWSDLYSPAALYALQDAGIVTRVTTNPVEVTVNGKKKKFTYGSIMIPVQLQNISDDILYQTLQKVAEKYLVSIHSVSTGAAISGSDLGSSRFDAINKPSVAMIVGTGVNATDAGEFWHLMDQRMNIPVSQLEQSTFNRVDLKKYTTLVLAGGSYGDLNKDKLRSWVQSGGVLILLEEAVSWAAQNGISNVTIKRAKAAIDTTAQLAYIEKDQIEGAQAMRGAIFGAEADLTHPLAYGYNEPVVSMFKANKVFMEKSKNPFATPFYYKSNPLQSGWLSQQNYNAVKNSAAVVVSGLGSGKIISIADNPNFRGFWLGGTKLMMNAIFFGKIIDTRFAGAE